MSRVIVNEFIVPREPMAVKLAKWCKKQGIVDTAFFHNDGTCCSWDYVNDKIITEPNHEFYHVLDGGKETYDFWVNHLANTEHATHIIGMTSEGSLNHALHYMTDYKLQARFEKFLAKYGYKWVCISNCYYMLYRLPSKIVVD